MTQSGLGLGLGLGSGLRQGKTVAVTVPLAGILLEAVTPGSRPGAKRRHHGTLGDMAYPQQQPRQARPHQISVT